MNDSQDSENNVILKFDINSTLFCCVYVFLLCIAHFILYGSDSFQFSLCGDELKETMDSIPDIYVAQKRWGIMLWKEVFGYGYLPYIGMILFCILSSITALVHVKIFNIKNIKCAFIYGIVYSMCPVWMNLLRFSHMDDIYALSMLMASLSVYYFLYKKGVINVLISSLLLILSISMYQIVVFYVPTLVCAWFLMDFFAEKYSYYLLIKYMILMLFSVAIYTFVSYQLRKIGIADASVIHMIDVYQAYFTSGWKDAFNEGSFLFILRVICHFMLDSVNYAFGLSYTRIFEKLFYLISGGLMLLLLLNKIITYGAKREYFRGFIVLILIILLFMLPYLAYVVSYGRMVDLRMYMGTGISVAVIWLLVYDFLRRKKVLTNFLFLTLAVMFTKGAYSHALVSRNNWWNYERSREMFFEMKLRANEVAIKEGLTDYKIYWVGQWWPIKGIDVNRALEYRNTGLLQGTVQPFAVAHYAAYFGCGNMIWDENKQEIFASMTQDMPCWPDQRSVKVIDGDVYIKVR